jgi:hypothetical protein
MPGAGSDRLYAHRNITRGTEMYNILNFETNRTEIQVVFHVIFEDPWMPGAGRSGLAPILKMTTMV